MISKVIWKQSLRYIVLNLIWDRERSILLSGSPVCITVKLYIKLNHMKLIILHIELMKCVFLGLSRD